MSRENLERWAPLVMLVAIVAVWQLACSVFAIPEFIFPSPLEIGRALGEFTAPIALAAWQTFWVTMVGFGLSIVVGVLLGFLVGSTRLAYAALFPLLVAFNAVPKAAVVPLVTALNARPGEIDLEGKARHPGQPAARPGHVEGTEAGDAHEPEGHAHPPAAQGPRALVRGRDDRAKGVSQSFNHGGHSTSWRLPLTAPVLVP